MAAVPTPRTAAGREGLAALLGSPNGPSSPSTSTAPSRPSSPTPTRPAPTPAPSRRSPGWHRTCCAVAVVTGRPAEAAVRHGGFAGARRAGPPHRARRLRRGALGRRHGHAQCRAAPARASPPCAPNCPVCSVSCRLRHGTWTEDKGRAVAVHTRRTDDPAAAFDLLRDPLYALAERHGLIVEPGRMVLELRPPGMDKGGALTEHAARTRRGRRPLRGRRPRRPGRLRRRGEAARGGRCRGCWCAAAAPRRTSPSPRSPTARTSWSTARPASSRCSTVWPT